MTENTVLEKTTKWKFEWHILQAEEIVEHFDYFRGV